MPNVSSAAMVDGYRQCPTPLPTATNDAGSSCSCRSTQSCRPWTYEQACQNRGGSGGRGAGTWCSSRRSREGCSTRHAPGWCLHVPDCSTVDTGADSGQVAACWPPVANKHTAIHQLIATMPAYETYSHKTNKLAL